MLFFISNLILELQITKGNTTSVHQESIKKRIHMKSWHIGIIALSLTRCCTADNFTQKLLPPKKDVAKLQASYQIIPAYSENNPDLTLIRSRKPQSMSLDELFLSMIESTFQTPNFVETGTYLGDTTKEAAALFLKVHSIELSKEFFEKAKKRFKNNKTINLYQGDSAKILATVLKNCKEKTTIFLDAHCSMGNTAKGETNTAIIAELEKIKQSGIKDAILLIDDTRMFYHPVSDVKNTFVEGYPTLAEIVKKVQEINPDYQCALIYDVLVAFPAQEKVTVSPLIRALTLSRLYEGDNYEIEDVLKAELFIASAKDEEKQIVLELATTCVEQWSQAAGCSRHYALWGGLIMLAQEDYAKALAYLQEAKKRGLHDWRIDWYIAMAQAQCFFAIR